MSKRPNDCVASEEKACVVEQQKKSIYDTCQRTKEEHNQKFVSAFIKSTLESKINLKPSGVKVLNCAPSAGNGIIIRIQTPEMLDTLQKSINDHVDLKNICQARAPKGRNPQLILYDVAPTGEPREEEERNFLENLRSSNDLPCGDMKVIFRRKGRGNLQHWIITVTPEIFKNTKDEKRLHLGFGSYKFREFVDPLRCFKCHKFGHTSKNCSVTDTL
ncbi:hypothetical protein AVEN_61408-1 [Araneus ventricosus]|uniref:CCHC-type domain-containing protein n=1 Tax=Araneus ventricosus TaxID=182803 RepID=A0A4Y2QDA8_ARAVE|nr:hypothetical protein AVEN_61408-1 [Araneus ventricosus]